ncbi:MAG: hypothetical protein K2N63_10285 [Lachnospiraceae bacterium]|nr:hypothetical protein [Lachnospiraceae bacterium]
MKHLKKLLSIFLILWILTGISAPGDGGNALSDPNPAPSDMENIIEE